MADGNRIRKREGRKQVVSSGRLNWFTNPYPWMSDPEAMVHLELERRQVPFSFRYFDGASPNREELMPDFHPEFTLSEYKVVILVIGGFFGVLPGVLDRNSLGAALLQADGWKVVALYENDIRNDLRGVFNKELPELVNPAVKGRVKPSPFPLADYMERRRQQLRGFGLIKQIFRLGKPEDPSTTEATVSESGRRRKRDRRVRRFQERNF